MTTLTFAPAVKQARSLRLALDGPSGSGKTYTALKIGTALAPRVAVIDTERHSAALYAEVFTFDTLALNTFEPDTLVAALAAAADAAYPVVIVDSMSHFWFGEGGMLEQVDNAGKRNGGNSFGGWKEARPMERRMIAALLSYPGHVIVTMRTKTEWVIEQTENRSGRTVSAPKRMGTKPEQREGIEYEFDVVGDMDLEHNLIISKTRCLPLTGKVFNLPGEDIATTLRGWLGSGEATPNAIDYLNRADKCGTREDLRTIWDEVKAAGLGGASVLNGVGDAVTLAEFLRERGEQIPPSEGAA